MNFLSSTAPYERNLGKGGLFMGDDSERKTKGKWSRREFLKAGVAGLGGAALGGLPGRYLEAPAVIKGTRLSILQGTYFFDPLRNSTRSRPRSGARPMA